MEEKKIQHNTFTDLLLVVLFVLTISLFGSWGYEMVLYILGALFNVEILEATPLSVFVGLVAMISSALVFTASAMWWLRKPEAKGYFKLGAAGFVVKNIFDVVNTTLIFGQVHANPTIYDIKMLAVELGGQMTQMAFWIFVFFFFGYVISHYSENRSSVEYQTTS